MKSRWNAITKKKVYNADKNLCKNQNITINNDQTKRHHAHIFQKYPSYTLPNEEVLVLSRAL